MPVPPFQQRDAGAERRDAGRMRLADHGLSGGLVWHVPRRLRQSVALFRARDTTSISRVLISCPAVGSITRKFTRRGELGQWLAGVTTTSSWAPARPGACSPIG